MLPTAETPQYAFRWLAWLTWSSGIALTVMTILGIRVCAEIPSSTSMSHERELPIGAAGIRVLTACSSLSTLSALVVKSIGIDEPRKVSAYLLPAYRQTANAGAVESFLASIEGNVRTLRF